MTTSLYVRLPHRPIQSPERWPLGVLASVPFALVREEGAQGPQRILREGTSRIDELPAADRLVLLLPAADVLLVPASVPPLALPKLRLALPNLVEERLVQDAQQCHIALGPRLGAVSAQGWRAPREPQARALMIADRAWIRFVLDSVAGHKHRGCHLLPAQLCLPLEAPAPAAAVGNDDAAQARTEPSLEPVGAEAAEAVDAEAPAQAPNPATAAVTTIALDAAPPSDDDAPPAVDITVRSGPADGYGLRVLPAHVADWLAIAPAPARLMVSPALRELAPALSTDPAAARLDWAVWAAGARAALTAGDADLCQFDFAHGGIAGMDWSAWRLPVALAVLIVAVQLIGMNAQWLTLRAEQKRLDAAMRTQLQTAFPNTPVILDPPAQMRRQVQQLRLAAGKSAPEDFLPLADRFAQAAAGLAPDALLALDYHGRALVVTLKEGTDTNMLRTAAATVGLKMDTAEAPRGGEATVPGSRWTVSIAQ
ncbi:MULTISPECIES: type II secretion system protein GspL [Ralstonia solanacearum species complex]|uniref:type II secretion system protein GspL n=1 Tax=Ralstonia solanacearum species complex TaxID=3116862 RepID=UPI000E591CD3|nr:type II secretion system protein GspL [Ralstonia solanacearum]BEU70704.1 type II secretion system protein GspL [Ralstonia pseudosolanacearum]AXV75729.1 general secretion pathway protein GspL [Ralstonia solanacearum]AXV89729.1 general secretion pathway protein GspL [Ralstonia solanacearum]AXW17934.1 general secretion pathway protein GspL [Ralstonia solanacearum]AXW74642.1 general secretion pathway protein GspL [Ralstonia solanacearum]